MSIFNRIKREIKTRWPKWLANRLYKQHFHRDINWNNPKEFNEKLRWIQFYTDTSKWSLLADKFRVRKYLEDRGYGHMLVKLYGVWTNANDIDFSILPNSFVIKTNHGSGSVYVVEDKRSVDLEVIRQKLNRDLTVKYGVNSAEPHYFSINPVIIAEELLVQDSNLSTSLIDYKFYCVYGKPQFCGVMYNRNTLTHKYNVRLYDNEWKDISTLLASTVQKGKYGLPCPDNFEEMKRFCEDVCKEFQFVRMDFYECQGKLYFGEFTFTPAACNGGSLGPKACEILAEKIDIE